MEEEINVTMIQKIKLQGGPLPSGILWEATDWSSGISVLAMTDNWYHWSVKKTLERCLDIILYVNRYIWGFYYKFNLPAKQKHSALWYSEGNLDNSQQVSMFSTVGKTL